MASEQQEQGTQDLAIPSGNLDDWYIDLITSRFLDNEHLQVLAGYPSNNHYQRIRKLVHYAYHLSKRNQGIVTSKDKTTIALYYINGEQKKTWRDWKNYLAMAWVTIGLRRALSVLNLEKRLGKPRKEQPIKRFMHVWFLAQHTEERTLVGLTELITFFRGYAAKNQIPIFIETTNRATLLMYRRALFKIYDEYEDKPSGIKMWYMIYDPADHPEIS